MSIRSDSQIFKLITGNEGKFRMSENITIEFEKAVLHNNTIFEVGKNQYYISRILFRLWKKILTTNFLQHLFTSIYRLLFPRQINFMIVLMGPKFSKGFPYFFRKGTKAIYIFDAWPSYYNYIVRFIKDFDIDFVFISSEQSAKTLNQLIGNENVFWIPEGVNPGEYKFRSFTDKDIDILSFGRKYELFHEKVVEPLAKHNINYLYSTDDKMVFPDQKSFVEGLAKTKISVCFPTNITHPERAGEIETMTNRFLQSMVSKCLVLGKAPEEMVQLFGYNPVVEVDMENPAEQIIEILKNIEKYHELIERNYKTVVENHTWLKRWELISTIISGKIESNKVGQ